ncbi:MAG: DUF4394 domain-containing protein, partial [Rubrobacteraceae bacterium]
MASIAFSAVSSARPIASSSVSAGENFGVDFNPVADALRIVNDADENFRVTFDGLAPNDTVV